MFHGSVWISLSGALSSALQRALFVFIGKRLTCGFFVFSFCGFLCFFLSDCGPACSLQHFQHILIKMGDWEMCVEQPHFARELIITRDEQDAVLIG